MVTSGPNNPGTLANDASEGITAWSNPTNAASSDNSYATVVSTGQSQYLKATNFGFSIPSGATINGIHIEAEMKVAVDSGDFNCDFTMYYAKAGTPGGAQARRATGTDAYYSYGSASNLLSTTWTPSDVNNSGFGGAVRANFGSNTYSCDHIRITVTYTPAAGGRRVKSTRVWRQFR